MASTKNADLAMENSALSSYIDALMENIAEMGARLSQTRRRARPSESGQCGPLTFTVNVADATARHRWLHCRRRLRRSARCPCPCSPPTPQWCRRLRRRRPPVELRRRPSPRLAHGPHSRAPGGHREDQALVDQILDSVQQEEAPPA